MTPFYPGGTPSEISFYTTQWDVTLLEHVSPAIDRSHLRLLALAL
jgi:hypothetical protein